MDIQRALSIYESSLFEKMPTPESGANGSGVSTVAKDPPKPMEISEQPTQAAMAIVSDEKPQEGEPSVRSGQRVNLFA